MKTKQSNEYITLGKIAIVDISTKKFPDASMKIDLDVWLDLLDQGIGRVSSGSIYAQVNLEGKLKRVHKLITPHFKFSVDHINGDPLDNRHSNLRDVTQHDNARNQKLSRANKSGYCGIRERKGRRASTWETKITSNGKQIHLGTFKALDKAIAVRKAAEVKLGFHLNHGAK